MVYWNIVQILELTHKLLQNECSKIHSANEYVDKIIINEE